MVWTKDKNEKIMYSCGKMRLPNNIWRTILFGWWLCTSLLSHPVCRGWLYVFVPVLKLSPALPLTQPCSRATGPGHRHFVHVITFAHFFFISFISGRIDGFHQQNVWLDFGRFPPSIFKIKHGICCISAKNGPIATKQRANTLIEL